MGVGVGVGVTAAPTEICAEVTESELPESVTEIVERPTEFKVTEKVPTPLVSVEFDGRLADPSLLVNCTVPV